MPIMRRYRWLLCARYREDLREIIGDFISWPEAQAAWQQWSAYLAKSGTVAAWKDLEPGYTHPSRRDAPSVEDREQP
jgi:hypothetical protein